MGSVLLSACALVLALQSAAGPARAQNALTTVEPPPSIICGLEGFQLDTLQFPESWQFTLKDKSHCIIPNGTSESDVKSCSIRFSVCKPLSLCAGLTNSSTCETVTLNDGTTHEYSIGDYRGNKGFEPLGGSVVGFTTIRQGSEPADSEDCTSDSVFETIMVWHCDKQKVWNPSSGDANSFFSGSTLVGTSHCLLRVDFGYSGACYDAPTLAPDVCQLQPYDFRGLASQDYWTATVPTDICYNPDSIGSCNIFVSFCGALPLTIDKGCYGAAICQVGINPNGQPYAYSMGLYKTAKYTDNKGVVGGGFHLDVENGSIPDDGKCAQHKGISTHVILLCNSSAKWTNQNLGSNFHIEHSNALDPCTYDIVLQYDGACEQVGPIVSGPSPQSFVGWILIGIFFFAVMVYLFVGAGYGYFVKGARGVEVIPNYAFWMLFLSFVLEGCKFSFNAITCFQFEGKIKNPLGGPGKSGIEYDKI